jgi:hypothetical protein
MQLWQEEESYMPPPPPPGWRSVVWIEDERSGEAGGSKARPEPPDWIGWGAAPRVFRYL